MGTTSGPAKADEPSDWRISPALRQQLLEALLPEQPGAKKMTYAEFLAWADEDTLAEWVNGEVIMTSPASDRHQDLIRFLTSLLGDYVEARALGVIRPSPFQMKLEHGREPDLIFVAREHLDRLMETHLNGPADLVVEIVSPDSIGRDRGDKFLEYARGGVPEYWLIDYQVRLAEFYHLRARRYRLALSGEEGVYHSQVLPGFWLKVEWLWQEPLPSPLRVLGEIAGIDPQLVEQFLQALKKGGEAMR